MRKVGLLVLLLAVGACSFPSTPGEGNLLHGVRQFQAPLFEYGARGEVIVSMADNVSKTGFFGKNYENIMAFRNVQSGEEFYLKTKLGKQPYDTAMLTIGEYEVTNLYLQYTYVTTEHMGNTTVTTTHIVRDEHFEGDDKIRFVVKPGRVTYIGHIDLIKPENQVAADGRIPTNSYRISDKSDQIPDKQAQKWRREFGADYVVDMMTVK